MKTAESTHRISFFFACCACLGMFFFSGCNDDLYDNQAAQGRFMLYTEDMGMQPSSRTAYFDDGTKYAVWAYNDVETILEDVKLSQEDGSTEGELEQTTPNVFQGTMDFYSLTWGTSTAPECTKSSGSDDYTFTHTRGENNILPDLFRAERKGCTANNTAGKVVLPFEHTLVKLRYEVVRHEAEELAGAVITKITIDDHAQGTLSVKTGEYTYQAEDSREKYIIYSQKEMV